MNKNSAVQLAFFVLVGSLVASCATGPKYSEIKRSIPKLASGSGRIYFYRTSFLGGAWKPDIRIDGTPVGRSISGGFFFVDKEPGTHVISTKMLIEGTLTIALEAGQTQYVRTYVAGVFPALGAFAEIVEPSLGSQEIAGLSYVGDPLATRAMQSAGTLRSDRESSIPQEPSPSRAIDERIGIEELEGLLPTNDSK